MTSDSDTRNTALRALVCLDLTNLDPAADAAAIDTLCARAQTRHGSVAAVCILPPHVGRAKASLDRTGIRVATVVNFPSGEGTAEATAAEARAAIADGADEIDMVVPWRALKGGDQNAIHDAVQTVKAACDAHTLKAILETGELADPALIGLAADGALKGGADFLKTSTGRTSAGATPEAAEILLGAIARHGGSAGFKVSGGVRTLADAATYLALADQHLGASRSGPKHFRIGASSLLDALLAVLDGRPGQDGDVA